MTMLLMRHCSCHRSISTAHPGATHRCVVHTITMDQGNASETNARCTCFGGIVKKTLEIWLETSVRSLGQQIRQLARAQRYRRYYKTCHHRHYYKTRHHHHYKTRHHHHHYKIHHRHHYKTRHHHRYKTLHHHGLCRHHQHYCERDCYSIL